MPGRHFSFPVSFLVRDAQLMLGALRDPIGAPVAARLPADFVNAFDAAIQEASSGTSGQKAATGRTGQLTQAQNQALAEVKRLVSAARNTAKLAFPDNGVLLRQEFHVGNSEPTDLPSILERAHTVQLSCVKYATALAEHGWLESDTAAFATITATLEGADASQEASKGEKKGVTASKISAANRLYAGCQSVQNAANLAYPLATGDSNENVVAARARFLMDTFPPQGTASAEPKESGQAPSSPATAPAATH
ncbi:MAG: hypothetical protein QM790_04545 [Nibricoccus sp.]